MRLRLRLDLASYAAVLWTDIVFLFVVLFLFPS